ncbi:MAG: glucose-1-phosphate thymidylyltransferase RfbA [Candidatus Binataceae bacterium]
MTERTAKGIVLAGGNGSRLRPLTLAVSKQLLPVFDKPMVFYPISVLMLAGIRNLLIISQSYNLSHYQALLGDGSDLGVQFTYAAQDEPRGLADAFLVASDFIGNEPVALVLGDNVLYGQGLTRLLADAARRAQGATVFAYRVPDPQQFGVVELDDRGGPLRIDEKPSKPRSDLALIGLYFYDNQVVSLAAGLKRSARGELEITDLNQLYLESRRLHVTVLGRGIAWLDTGTFGALLDASNFIATLERRQNLKVACLEEIAWRNKWISDSELERCALRWGNDEYARYLLRARCNSTAKRMP